MIEVLYLHKSSGLQGSLSSPGGSWQPDHGNHTEHLSSPIGAFIIYSPPLSVLKGSILPMMLSAKLAQVKWNAASSAGSIFLCETDELPWLGKLTLVLKTPSVIFNLHYTVLPWRNAIG